MTRDTRRSPVVVKFGGASLRSAAAVADRLLAYRQAGEVVVVVASARAGVTDAIERMLRTPVATLAHQRALGRIEGLHSGLSAADRGPLRELRRRIRDLERRGHVGPAMADRIRSLGERLAVRWLAEQLRSSGLPAEAVDADRLGLRTDSAYGGATIDLEASRAPVGSGIRALLRRERIPVITGFFGRSPGGGVAVLGRGGSDYSATAIGHLIGARRVDLIKPGRAVRSADPRTVPTSRAVPALTYATAEELAHFGARILHPLSIEPARRGPTAIRVVGSGSESSETTIADGGVDSNVRIVTASAPLRRILVPVVGGRHRPGALSEVAQRLADADVPILGVFTGASHLALLIPSAAGVRAGTALAGPGTGRLGLPTQPGEVVVVSVVGDSLLGDLSRIPPALLARALEVSAGPRSIAVVVPTRDAAGVVRSLHRALVENPTPEPGRRRRRSP